MARAVPATVKGRRARQAIVTTAAQLMHERGIAATTMDDVLTASGTGKSQAYHYFRGKQELTVAVMEHQLERILDAQPALRDETCADLTQWRDQVLDAFRDSNLGNCPLGTFAGQVDNDPALRETLARLFEHWRAAITALVHRARDAGTVRSTADPEEAGGALLAALEGGTMLAHLTRDETVLRRTLDAALHDLIQ